MKFTTNFKVFSGTQILIKLIYKVKFGKKNNKYNTIYLFNTASLEM